MNIFLVGEAGSGKDSVADMLYGFNRIAFADELRLLAKNLRINGTSAAFLHATRLLGEAPSDMMRELRRMSQIPRTTKDRELLQELGMYIRSHDECVWIKHLLAKIKPGKSNIVTDVRYYNELYALKVLGFYGVYIDCHRTIRVERLRGRDGEHNEHTEAHSAEREIKELRKYCDVVLDNNEDIEKLRDSVRSLCLS